MHLASVAVLSLLATLALSFVAAGSAPGTAAVPGPSARGSDAAPVTTPTVNPTVIPTVPLKCLQKGVVSYCVPNTFKYQVCSPTTKVVECPIDSVCKDTTDAKGNKIAYCKFIG